MKRNWQQHSSGKPNMQKESGNVHTNHIIVNEKFESAKEKCEIRSLKEAPTSVMNISTKFITDNRKARLKKSKTYAEIQVKVKILAVLVRMS